MRIIFVRHGEPDYAHDCLTALGRVQANACAERLVRENIKAVYSSPFGRALETASIVAGRISVEPVHILDFMHELHWGSKSGREIYAYGHPWAIADEMSRTGWDLTRPDWPSHPFFWDNAVTENVTCIAEKTDDWLFSIGYKREGLYYRCLEDNPHSVAVFSHGGSSVAMLSRILNLPFPYLCATMHFHFTGITILRFDSHSGSRILPCLELVNDGDHVRELPSGLP